MGQVRSAVLTGGRSLPGTGRVWLGLAGAACGCAAVAIIDPTDHMLTPPCPFRVITGWWCPFCGATRAVSKLLQGDLSAAFRYNAMLLILGPVVVLLWATWAVPDGLRWLDPLRRRHERVFMVVAAALTAFTVVRNLPLASDWLRYPGA